jgi:putative tryptophan/tyrosine transport system substrate-binding protein
VRRRNFISLLGGAAMAWPLAARAQKSTIPVIGLLAGGSFARGTPYDAAFRQGLNETGYVEGKNVAMEFRSTERHNDRLAGMAADLVSRHVAVLVATGTSVVALAAKAATSTIPIVFITGGDPVESGIVASLSQPGGNITGVIFFADLLEPKRLELLHELAPKATVIALLVNPDSLAAESVMRKAQEAVVSLGQQLHVLRARTEQDIDAAFATLVQLQARALAVASHPLFFFLREKIVRLAAHHAVPAIFEFREFVTAGGLMSYGASLAEAYRQAGIYTGKILHGAKPADLPVLQPTTFELVINTRTAKALGLTIPQSLRVQAELIA